MLKVHFTSALKRFFPKLETLEIEANNLPLVIKKVDAKFPGMSAFILDDGGKLRKHVNIFIGEDLAQLDSELKANDEVFIFQALSGG